MDKRVLINVDMVAGNILTTNAGLAASDKMLFLTTYKKPKIAVRYQCLLLFFHRRMACLYQWKVDHGASDYAPAPELEIQALERHRGPIS